jgi:FMN phosphatase YigB (HAD superfamily)
VIGYAKPSPLAYQHITNALSVAPHECLFFDDEQSCVDGARAVGMIAHLVDRENECIPLDHLVSDSFAAISTM